MGGNLKNEKSIFKEIKFNGFQSAVQGGRAYLWQASDNDLHYPENTYMKPNSITTMDNLIYSFLDEWGFFDAYPNTRFVLVSANLEGGGFFDDPDFGTNPPWSRLHQTHRTGDRVDISRNLSGGYGELDSIYRKRLADFIWEQSNQRSFCRYETRGTGPHFHCKFD